MEQTRFEKEIEQLRKIDGVGGENVIKSLEDIAPDVGKYIIEFASRQYSVQRSVRVTPFLASSLWILG